MPLFYYKEQDGLLSNYLNLNLRINDNFQPKLMFKEEAYKRINLLNSFMLFIERNKISPSGAHIYYDYWPRVGLKNYAIQFILTLGLL